ncbi:MAG: type I-E CRISPR-associated protein Cse2/CasB [Acidobacteria bacterium]|nr:type I-E CRISPR-associated protein Cse2/CasB [Acidobacteriota bacterium]
MNEEFIQMLVGFHRQENRAALAMLRRGLGKQPGEAMEVYRYIGNFAANTKSKTHETALHTVATLFGLYPSLSREGNQYESNLGASVSELSANANSDSIEKRFVALLDAHSDDLPNHLRQVVGLLKANEVKINWLQLLNDINWWDSDGRDVQRRWAKSFQWKQK